MQVQIHEKEKNLDNSTVRKKVSKKEAGPVEENELKIGVDEEKEFKLKEKTIEKNWGICMQNGYRSKKNTETSIAGQDKTFDIKFDDSVLKNKSLKAETLDKERITFRSGYQGLSSDNQTSDLDLITKGVKNGFAKIRNTGIYGDSNGSNGHNGIMKNKLYISTYLDSDGVGTRV